MCQIKTKVLTGSWSIWHGARLRQQHLYHQRDRTERLTGQLSKLGKSGGEEKKSEQQIEINRNKRSSSWEKKDGLEVRTEA